MKLTLRLLRKINACEEFIEKWKDEGSLNDIKKVFDLLIKENSFDWILYLVSRLLNKENRIKYAIYVAEKVLYVFENKSLDDRPRETINAIKRYLKNPTEKDKNDAIFYSSLCSAIYNINDACYYVSYSAFAIIYAITFIVYAVVFNNDDAIFLAIDAYPCASLSINSKLQNRIIKYGIKLLNKQKGVF